MVCRNALSDGFIHHFFYCYRYFATPQDLFTFLLDKFTAATLSLSPEAEVPVKVKARTLDILQVWIEGYYGIDFKHDPHLTKSLYTFIKEQVWQTLIAFYGEQSRKIFAFVNNSHAFSESKI